MDSSSHLMKRNGTHFFRLNPLTHRRAHPVPDVRSWIATVLDIPAILFWLTLTLSSVVKLNKPIRIFFELFVVSTKGTGFLYFTNLFLPLTAFSLCVLSFEEHRRKTDLSVTVACVSAFLLFLIILYSFGRYPHSVGA